MLAFSLMINLKSKQVINPQKTLSILIAVCLIGLVNNLVKDDYMNLNKEKTVFLACTVAPPSEHTF